MRAGNLRVTSPSDAQAASFSPSAASDWPRRSSASGASRVRLVFGGDVEEGLGRVAEALALEQALAEPEGGVAGQPDRSDISSEKARKPSSASA